VGCSGWTAELDRRMLRVQRALITGHGRQTFESPKTPGSRHCIDLTAKEVTALLRHRSHRRAEGFLVEGDTLVFTNGAGKPVSQPFAPDLSFVQAPAQTCGSAGDYLSRRDPSHQLPHPPFARCQLEGGKLQLGRDSVAFTMQKCAHFLPGFGDNGAIDSALS
jgi:hypothetical protein